MSETGLSASNSLFDVRRQSALPSPQELKDFIEGGQRNPSVIAKERDTCHCAHGVQKQRPIRIFLVFQYHSRSSSVFIWELPVCRAVSMNLEALDLLH